MKQKSIDKKRVKILIQEELEIIEKKLKDKLFDDEQRYSKEVMEYLNLCLWVHGEKK